MNRFGKKYLAVVCGAMIVLSGCGGSSNDAAGNTAATEEAASAQESTVEEKAEAAATDASEDKAEIAAESSQEKQEEGTAAAITELPPYEYPDEGSIYHEVARYLIADVGSMYEKADVCIPSIREVAIDESKADDVLFYCDCWIDNFNLQGDTLEADSGGNYSGVIHLKKTDAGYEATSFDICEDGNSFDESAKKLFGKHYDDFMKIHSDDVSREDARTQTITDYVFVNGLPITSYQDYGWDPVPIVIEDGYDGPADFVQEQSGKTEFKDFDDVIANLKQGQGYATINLYGYDGDILAVAETVFEADHSAPEASLYVDIGSGAKQLTLVSGNGSAYPLRIADGILYGGDNHNYESYFAYENEERVGVMAKDYVSDGDGAGQYTGFLREDNTYDNDKEFTGGQKEFEDMLAKRDKCPVIEFTVVK